MTFLEYANTDPELCLKFANTVEWHASHQPQEKLLTYKDLVTWAQGAGILPEGETAELLRIAKERPVEAKRALQNARGLREAIYRILVGEQKGAAEADLEILNQALSQAMSSAHLVRSPDGFTWGWETKSGPLEALLGPIARSAAALLTSEMRDRVGQCADDRGCGYLFLDTSKNRSRVWCSMGDCGNRAKQRRHYQRTTKSKE